MTKGKIYKSKKVPGLVLMCIKDYNYICVLDADDKSVERGESVFVRHSDANTLEEVVGPISINNCTHGQ